jgi:hypothetical protein
MTFDWHSTPGYPFTTNVSASLEQVTEPLADFEIVAAALMLVAAVVEVKVIKSHWRRFGRTSHWKIKYPLALMYGSIYASLPFALVVVLQAATPSYVPNYFVQNMYPVVLVVSECLNCWTIDSLQLHSRLCNHIHLLVDFVRTARSSVLVWKDGFNT